MRQAIFLDRDGTLIREVHYLSSAEQLELLPGVSGALRRLAEAGYLLIGVTNQSGVARGYFTLEQVNAVHQELERRLRTEGTGLDAIYLCPHHPDFTSPCGCRKPAPGLVVRACADWGIDVSASWVIGDKAVDVELAREAGCRSALVRTGYGEKTERELEERGVGVDVVADGLEGAAEEILRR